MQRQLGFGDFTCVLWAVPIYLGPVGVLLAGPHSVVFVLANYGRVEAALWWVAWPSLIGCR